MAVRTNIEEGVFNLVMSDQGEKYNQKIGYIKDNILDKSSSDTDLVSSDLFTAAVAIEALTGSSISEVDVNYTVSIFSS